MAVPGKIKQRIGKGTKAQVVEVEKGQIRRFAAAIGEDNPIHFDEKIAKASGFSSLVGPPTFATALIDQERIFSDLELDTQSTMHAEEEYEYFRPICAGDRISIAYKVVDTYTKQAPNGRLLFVIIEVRGADARSRPVFKTRRVIVELKH